MSINNSADGDADDCLDGTEILQMLGFDGDMIATMQTDWSAIALPPPSPPPPTPPLLNLPADCVSAVLDGILAQHTTPRSWSGINPAMQQRFERLRTQGPLAPRFSARANEQLEASLLALPEANKELTFDSFTPESWLDCDPLASTPDRWALSVGHASIEDRDQLQHGMPAGRLAAIQHALSAAPPPTPLLPHQQPYEGCKAGPELLNYYDKVKDEVVGVRRRFEDVVTTTRDLCALRLVCKTFDAHLRDYCFRPYVELVQVSESADAVVGSPALYGAVPRDVLFAGQPHGLRIYMRRKAFKKDENCDLVDSWEYIAPQLAAVGCNCLRIVYEAEPDVDGHVQRFDASNEECSARSIEGVVTKLIAVQSQGFGSAWKFESQHLVMCESGFAGSYYSLHLPCDWSRRWLHTLLRGREPSEGRRVSEGFPTSGSPYPEAFTCNQGHLLTVYAKKFPGDADVHGHPIPRVKAKVACKRPAAHRRRQTLQACGGHMQAAYEQTLEFSVIVDKTSRSLDRAGKPLRAMRLRVEFGAVKADRNDRYRPFEPRAIADFVTVMHAVSPYFYASNKPLDPRAVGERAKKRRERTACDREHRERQKLALDVETM
jgi:hypothetical protein